LYSVTCPALSLRGAVPCAGRVTGAIIAVEVPHDRAIFWSVGLFLVLFLLLVELLPRL
jgi:hypothetical protein